MFCSTGICLITAFCEPLLLPDHNELQQPWTIIYSSLCVSINTPNSWLCVCESPLTGSHLLLDTLTGWNGLILISVHQILVKPVIKSGWLRDENTGGALHQFVPIYTWLRRVNPAKSMWPKICTTVSTAFPCFPPALLVLLTALPSFSEDVQSGTHIIVIVLVVSVVLIIVALLACYFLRWKPTHCTSPPPPLSWFSVTGCEPGSGAELRVTLPLLVTEVEPSQEVLLADSLSRLVRREKAVTVGVSRQQKRA